jgi:uncharacterized membrane protein
MTRSIANLAIFVLSLVGCVISLFLTIKYIQSADIPCTGGSSDCNAVANDSAAWGLGIEALKRIPTPALGLLMYATLAALSMLRVVSENNAANIGAKRAQWAISFIGVGVSAYLTWREAAVIHHWCVWCVGSAIIVLILFLISSSEQAGGLRATRKESLEAT